MAIAMKLRYVDPVCDNSLKSYFVNGEKMGYQFDVRLACYRGHFLSLINELSVTTDGEAVPERDITFCLHGKEYGIEQMKLNCNDFWPIAEAATIRIHKKGGLPEGDHEIDFHLIYRCPYMPIGELEYMPWDSSQKKVLTLKEYLH